MLLADHGKITLAELLPEVARPSTHTPPGIMVAHGGAAAGTASDAQTAPSSLRDVERQQILAALEQTGWHRGKTAEILGISPSTLYRRLRDYNLERRS